MECILGAPRRTVSVSRISRLVPESYASSLRNTLSGNVQRMTEDGHYAKNQVVSFMKEVTCDGHFDAQDSPYFIQMSQVTGMTYFTVRFMARRSILMAPEVTA